MYAGMYVRACVLVCVCVRERERKRGGGGGEGEREREDASVITKQPGQICYNRRNGYNKFGYNESLLNVPGDSL